MDENQDIKPGQADLQAVDALFAIMAPLSDMFSRRTVRCGDEYYTQLQLKALKLLKDEGPLAMNEISTALRMSKQQLTRFVDTLVKRSLMERFHKDNNRRTIYVRVTELGISEVNNFRKHMVEEQAPVLTEKASEEDKKHIAEAATLLAEMLEKYWGINL